MLKINATEAYFHAFKSSILPTNFQMEDQDQLTCNHRNYSANNRFELHEANKDLVNTDYTKAQVDTLTETLSQNLHKFSSHLQGMVVPPAYTDQEQAYFKSIAENMREEWETW